MPAFMLTWNPRKWGWPDLAERAAAVRKGDARPMRWSSGGRRNIPLGARVFLLRQGVEPKGIVASGWVTDVPRLGPHWDLEKQRQGEQARYVTFTFDALLDVDEQPLDLRPYSRGPLSLVNVNIQGSGSVLADAAGEALSVRWARHIQDQGLEVALGDDSEVMFPEGDIRYRFVAHRHRERALRSAKLQQALASNSSGRLECEVPGCQFDFLKVYGDIGAEFAHVHHLQPLGKAVGSVQTRLEDLAVVCANCHAMIHQGGECRPLNGLIVGSHTVGVPLRLPRHRDRVPQQ